MAKIAAITARSILDSRGIPTVEARVSTEKSVGVAAVPSGTSTGSHEAKELRDGDRRWGGQGVTKAVSHINLEIASALKGKEVSEQSTIDRQLCELDGTEDKSRLGANAILAVSLACLKAAAGDAGRPLWTHVGQLAGNADPTVLPLPLCNVINGGAHADNSLAIQEFMLVPHGFDTFAESLRAATETFHALGSLLKGRGVSTAVGAEGGYAPDLDSHQAALDLMMQAVQEAGYQSGSQISLALDVAASELLQGGGADRERHDAYMFDQQPLTADQMVAQYASMLDGYPIVSLEDPLGEDDWDGWERLSARLGAKTQIVGDDLTVTSAARIEEAAKRDAIGAAILKLNQIGTYSETFTAYQALEKHGLRGIISHRSGETTDTTIADIAVGWGVPMIKTGSLSRGERVSKYNRLLEIEQHLGGSAIYAGKAVSKSWGRTK